jgi:hypothetical protein
MSENMTNQNRITSTGNEINKMEGELKRYPRDISH